MTHHTSTSNRRNRRAFVATLLAYVLLTSQLAPIATAFSRPANRQTFARTPGNMPSEAPPQGASSSFAPVPVPLRVTASGMAPIITATKVDSFPDPDGDGKVSPGQTITYNVTLTNTGPDPALNLTLNDTVDPNTTIVPGSAVSTPIAFNDAYNVIGNVRIQPNAAQGLLANDINPNTGNNTGLTASGPTTSTQGGNVAINADGSFSYDPPVGFTGTDTFTYTATSANGVDTRTVTLTVAGMIFFVNDDDPTAGGDGRLTNPFNCLVGAGCFTDSTADEAGDNIFLFNGAYTGGLALLANQKLIGQGATDTLANISGVGTVQPYSDPLPVTNNNPANVTITTAIAATNALTVSAGGITLRGFTVGNTTGAKIFGSGFGALTAGNSVSPDLILNGSGKALELTNGSFVATSRFSSVSTASSTSQGISLSTVTGTVSFGSTTVSGATTQGILVGTTTADINFGNTSVTGGTDGISLQNNSSGTRTFGTLSVSGNSGVGFLHAIGGGTTTVTGATTITNPTGVGIDVDGSNANLSFAATTVNKDTTSGIGVDLTNNATRTIGFTSLTVTTTNAFSLNTNNSGTVNAGGGSLTQSGAGGGAASLTNTTLGLTFTSISSNNGGNGIIISGGSGTLASGTTNLQNNAGIGLLMSSSAVAANFGNTTVNSSAGDGVDLSSNTGAITFADLDITPDANLRGLDASNNTGTITSTSGDIATTGAPAINISGPAGRTPLSMTLTNVDSTNSTTLGVDLNLVSGNLTVNDPGTATNIQGPAGIGIQVQNTGAGTVNLGDTVVNSNAGTGVFLNNNQGAVSFGSLDITPDSGQTALQATNNTGTITSTSGTIAAPNATAINIDGPAGLTPLNLTLTSVTSSGGTANGISIQDTSGTGFNIVGDGSNTSVGGNSSGGTIAGKSGADNNNAQGIGIFLSNVSNITLRRMTINGTNQNFGIRGLVVNNFTLEYSTVGGTNGTTGSLPAPNNAGEGSIYFGQNELSGGQNGLTGSATITNCNISGGSGRNFSLINIAGTLNRITITGTTFGLNQNSVTAGSSLAMEARQSGTVLNATVTGSTFTGSPGDAANFTGQTGTTMDVIFGGVTATRGTAPGNTITNTHPQNIIGGSNLTFATQGVMNFHCLGNTMRDANGSAVTFFKASAGTVMNGFFDNNEIGASGVSGSGSLTGNGIFVSAAGAGTMSYTITNNLIHRVNGNFHISADNTGGSYTANFDIRGNTFDTPGAGNAGAIGMTNGSPSSSDTVNVCAVIGGSPAADKNTLTGFPAAGQSIFLGSSGAGGGHTFNLPGLSASTEAAVESFVSGNNNMGGTTVDAFADAPATFAAFTGTGTNCGTPSSAPEEFTDLITPGGPPPGEMPNGASVEQAASNNVTSRPFISSPRQQPTVTGNKAAAQVVARPRPAPAPGPAPIQPPTAIDEPPTPQPPMIVGDNLTWNVGTLPAGQSVTITFQVVVDNPFMGAMPQVSNQGTVTADGGISVLTDDPAVGGSNDPTVTLVTVPPDLFVRDARVAEPASGSAPMIFTLALSTPAPVAGIAVDLSTADGSATGGDCASGDDYTTVTNGTVTFASGEQIKTFPVTVCSDANVEGDETFSLNVNSAPGAVIVDSQGIGTITANVPGTTLISELRTSGPGGAGDAFVETYNNTDTPHTVPAGGYGLFKMGTDCNAVPVLVGTIPAATVIPQRGHYLFVGSTYSLANYGGTGAAAGDQTLMADIESDFNVGLFSTIDPLAISTANRLDAVGFGTNTGGVCDLLRESTTLSPASGSTSEYSFVREFTLVGNNVPTPTDGNDNVADFTVISTTPGTPVGSRLGAPGPENLASPNLKKFSQVGAQLIDPMVAQSSPPNRARDTTPDPANNSTLGTLASRRTFTNNTGAPITRLRFRIYDITTFPSPPGTADLRVRTSSNVVVTVTGVGSVTALATTLETPPAQPNSGGLNSSLAAGTVTLGTPLASGASINLNFLFGVQQTGSFRVFVFVEAVP
jgi:hypothetical protein